MVRRSLLDAVPKFAGLSITLMLALGNLLPRWMLGGFRGGAVQEMNVGKAREEGEAWVKFRGWQKWYGVSRAADSPYHLVVQKLVLLLRSCDEPPHVIILSCVVRG